MTASWRSGGQLTCCRPKTPTAGVNRARKKWREKKTQANNKLDVLVCRAAAGHQACLLCNMVAPLVLRKPPRNAFDQWSVIHPLIGPYFSCVCVFFGQFSFGRLLASPKTASRASAVRRRSIAVTAPASSAPTPRRWGPMAMSASWFDTTLGLPGRNSCHVIQFVSHLPEEQRASSNSPPIPGRRINEEHRSRVLLFCIDPRVHSLKVHDETNEDIDRCSRDHLEKTRVASSTLETERGGRRRVLCASKLTTYWHLTSAHADAHPDARFLWEIATWPMSRRSLRTAWQTKASATSTPPEGLVNIAGFERTPPPRHANKAMTSAMSFAPVQPIHLPLNGSRTPRKSPPQWPRCLWWPKADYFPEQIRVPIGKSTSPNAARLRCRKPPQLAHQTITQAEVGVEPTIIFRQVSSAYPLKSRTCGTKRWSSRPWWAPGRTQVNRGGPCRSVGEDSTIQGRGNSLRLIIRIAFNSSRLNSDECERRAFSMLLLA